MFIVTEWGRGQGTRKKTGTGMDRTGQLTGAEAEIGSGYGQGQLTGTSAVTADRNRDI